VSDLNRMKKCEKYKEMCKIWKLLVHRKQMNENRDYLYKIWCNNVKVLCISKELTVFVYTILSLLSYVAGQTNQNVRPFPALFNAAHYRPVFTEPSQGTCGVRERSAYCRSSMFPLSVETCNQDFCVQQCPSRTEMPPFLNLLLTTTAFSTCVFNDTINVRPGSAFQSASTSFIAPGPTCFVTPSVTPNLPSSQQFTISLWIWPKRNNNG